jgi:aspartate/methionine/tyrosine aminotransferase
MVEPTLQFLFTEKKMMFPKPAQRTHQAAPFYAVEVAKKAAFLRSQGQDIISLGIGEPDFTAAPQVVEAMQKAAKQGLSGYSPAAGLPALREAISKFYGSHFNAPVDPRRVIVTNGGSGALMLAALTLIDPGAEVLMPDPCYPANANFILAAGGVAKLIPTQAANRFQLCAADIETHWNARTRGILVASPSNPTGTSIAPEALAALLAAVKARNGFVIMDEIYLGLSYDSERQSALVHDDQIIILNSFSKYFHMTGWRLGWLIVPDHLVEALEKLASSLAICAPTLAQYGALACFEAETLLLFEQRRQAFQMRRDFLVPALESIGFTVPARPDGAFYVYADVTRHSHDSSILAEQLLDRAGVAIVPGLDFGPAHAKHMARMSYTTGLDQLKLAVERMDQALNKA